MHVFLSVIRGGSSLRFYLVIKKSKELLGEYSAIKIRLFEMANCYLCLEFDAYSSELWFAVCAYLVEELGFERRGELIDGWDEGISPSFVRDGLELQAGWSHWADGDYLLAACPRGDQLLREIFAAMGPDLSFQPQRSRPPE